jgi:hypothetical protein
VTTPLGTREVATRRSPRKLECEFLFKITKRDLVSPETTGCPSSELLPR